MLRQFWLLNGCRVKNADIFCGLDKNHKITEIIENIPLKEYNIIIMYSEDDIQMGDSFAFRRVNQLNSTSKNELLITR